MHTKKLPLAGERTEKAQFIFLPKNSTSLPMNCISSSNWSVAPADAGKTVAQLLGEVEVKAPRTLVLEPGAYPPALVLANFRDKDVDTLLDLMRQAQVTIPLKAVVTPANRNWMFADLLAHLQEEHTAFTAAKESQTV